MKLSLTILTALGSFTSLFAQSNTFPASGSAGVGTLNPSAKLEVVGDIKNSHGTVTMPLGDWRTLTVGGSAAEFYPVRIPTSGYRRDIVEIMQANVHADGASYGSMHFVAQFNNNGWGTVASIDRVLLNTRCGSNSYVARFSDAAWGIIPVVWLRGDQTYQYRLTSDGSLSVVGYTTNTQIYDSTPDQYDRYVSPLAVPDETVPLISGYELAFANGNVGIGTAGPNYRLEVLGPSGTYPARVGTPDGYLQFGPANTGWSHFDTDRPKFYFNKGVTVDSGNVGSYDEDLNLQTAGTTRLTILNGSGNVGIGTAAPNQSLSINGNLSLGTTDSFIMMGHSAHTGGGGYIFLKSTGDAGRDFNIQNFSNASGWSTNLFVAGETGNVGIGTTSPTHKLSVNGTIKTKEVIVETTGWADDVFSPGYSLPTLDSVEQHIAEKGHLPGIPSATEVAENGVAIGTMQAALLRKMEEMTLYMLEMKKENAALRARVDDLEARN